MAKKLKMNQRARKLIVEALGSARLERCAIGVEHQEAMRLYLDTWVAGRLEQALKIIDGEG